MKTPLGDEWEILLKWILRETGCRMDYIHLTQDICWLSGFVITVMKPRVPYFEELSGRFTNKTGSVVRSGSMDDDDEGRTSSANFRKENI
jgi:hypothetical protein